MGLPIEWCNKHQSAAMALSAAFLEEDTEEVNRLLGIYPFLKLVYPEAGGE